jgi:hypothetical protein
MSAFDVISLSISAISLLIAFRIKRPVIIPHIHFGKTQKKLKHNTLQEAIDYVKKRDAKKLYGRDRSGRFVRKIV